VPRESLPHALDALPFSFPALAALSGRLPLGGGREVALAALLTARLAEGATIDDGLPVAERVSRASAAKVWLASMALPAATRVPFARLIEATTGATSPVGAAVRAVISATEGYLDAAAVQELDRLARRLGA